ncbi:hypothetical protein RSO68_13815 [Halomonas saccharevitans]|uniref:DUF4239 domain-containing protein n=1 Tax=Halomonas saccharevitans TaxID=416872 RepID=A0ABU3NHA0_9GAMM|nr:hypothetical protein [Halomonas saccharevitans]MDT8880550.1 hypothetical protein [Halomonas saccharevitans]
MSLLAHLPNGLLIVVIVLVASALALLPYLLARRVMLARADQHSKDLAGSVLFRIGALHSLILALIFAQELLNFSEARHAMTREAALVGDIYYDLQRYDDETTASMQAHLVDYTAIVLEREWQGLAQEGRLDAQAWAEWESVYEAILDLVPETLRQESLRDIMVVQARELSELRINRETAALIGTNDLFFFAAIAGIVVMSIGYFPFPPTPVNLTLLLLFGVYTGLVLYFIVAFSNPFSAPGFVEPLRFERLIEAMRSAAG